MADIRKFFESVLGVAKEEPKVKKKTTKHKKKEVKHISLHHSVTDDMSIGHMRRRILEDLEGGHKPDKYLVSPQQYRKLIEEMPPRWVESRDPYGKMMDVWGTEIGVGSPREIEEHERRRRYEEQRRQAMLAQYGPMVEDIASHYGITHITTSGTAATTGYYVLQETAHTPPGLEIALVMNDRKIVFRPKGGGTPLYMLDVEKARVFTGAELYEHAEEIRATLLAVSATASQMRAGSPYKQQVEAAHVLLLDLIQKLEKYERKVKRTKLEAKKKGGKKGEGIADLLIQIEQSEAKVKRIVKS